MSVLLSQKHVKMQMFLLRNLHFQLLAMLILSCTFLYSQEKQEASIDLLFLSAKEIESHSNPNIRYFVDSDPGYPKTLLLFQNFPLNTKILAFSKRLAQKDEFYEKVSEFFINQQGKILPRIASKGINSYFSVSSRGYLPGERIILVFATQDGDFEIETSFIPNPIRVKNKDETAFVEAELTGLFPTYYKFNFGGFKENETIKYVSLSGEEKIKRKFKITKDLFVAISPDVLGEKGGIAKNFFMGQSKEKFELNLPWGVNLLDYLSGNKLYKPN